MECSRNRKQASRAGVGEQRGDGQKVGEVVGVHIASCGGHTKESGSHWGKRGQFKQKRNLLLF